MKTNPDNQSKRKVALHYSPKKDAPVERRLQMLNDTDDEFFNPTDDMFDDEIVDPGHHLKTNEEIFTDEYMRDFAAKMDAKIAREKRQNKLITLGVILGCIIIIGVFCLYAYYVNFL